MTWPLLVALALAAQAPARAGGREFLYCERRIDCAKDPGLEAPRNALLVSFQDADFTGPFAWIRGEKAAVLRGVNQLLAHYGFPVRAQEIGAGQLRALREHPDADVILKYRANSFLAIVGDKDVMSNQGGTHIVGVESIDDSIMIFGPTRHPGFSVQDSDIELIEIRPVRELGDERVAVPRRRAMLAAMLVHEFVHAAHHRAMGAVVSGPPAMPLAPACVVPYEKASEATTKLMRMLQFSRSSGHMTQGLMAAGQDHSGNMNDVYGGGKHSLRACLSDARRVAAALMDDLAALARHDGLCGPDDEDGPGYPASDYLDLPQPNRAFIGMYLNKMSSISCYGGCYYKVLDSATAMKRAGYDPARYLTLERQAGLTPSRTRVPQALPHDPRHEAWWVEANRLCAARRSGAR